MGTYCVPVSRVLGCPAWQCLHTAPAVIPQVDPYSEFEFTDKLMKQVQIEEDERKHLNDEYWCVGCR